MWLVQDDCAGGRGWWQPAGPGNLDLHGGCATDCFLPARTPLSLMHFVLFCFFLPPSELCSLSWCDLLSHHFSGIAGRLGKHLGPGPICAGS